MRTRSAGSSVLASVKALEHLRYSHQLSEGCSGLPCGRSCQWLSGQTAVHRLLLGYVGD